MQTASKPRQTYTKSLEQGSNLCRIVYFCIIYTLYIKILPYISEPTHVANEKTMKIQIINESHHPLPQYATPQSAGLDLRANLDAPITLQPMERRLVPTGLRIALPQGYEAQVRPRSGLALKHGITLLNTPGTIDADYRGEIGIILVNLSTESFTIADGDRIAQLVIARYEQAEWTEVNALDATERGEGGFGHSGKQ